MYAVCACVTAEYESVSFDLAVNLNESVPHVRCYSISHLMKHSSFLINKHNYILCVNI